MDGKDNRRVVILALIANEGDKVKMDELSSNLCNLLPTNNRCKIAEPLERNHGSKIVFLDRCGCTTHNGLYALSDVHKSDALGVLLVCLVGVERGEVFWGVVRLMTNETAKEGGNDELRDDDLAIN